MGLVENIRLNLLPVAHFPPQNKIRLVKILTVSGTDHDHLLSRSPNHKNASIPVLSTEYLTDFYEKNHKRQKKQEKKIQNNITAKAEGKAQRVCLMRIDEK